MACPDTGAAAAAWPEGKTAPAEASPGHTAGGSPSRRGGGTGLSLAKDKAIERLRGLGPQGHLHGEAWHRDDALLLNLPVFAGCGLEFKRRILRQTRCWELSFKGQETWYDSDLDQICTLETLPEEVLPPLRKDLIGQSIDAGEYVCRGGDYDTKLVLVVSGTVEKLVGDSPFGGRCVVRTLTRGDCEGLTEFLGVGSEQRTCCLRGGEGGARVRLVTRENIQELLKMETTDEEGNVAKRWPAEVDYFAELALDRIDSLHHKSSLQLLTWPTGYPDEEPVDLMRLPGQTLFSVDSGLGTSVSGPLPEGIEERYFLDGQVVLEPERRGDCCILILRGEAEADVPMGAEGQCRPRPWRSEEYGWLGSGRVAEKANQEDLAEEAEEAKAAAEAQKEREAFLEYRMKMGSISPKQLMQLKIANEVSLVAIVPPEKLRHAKRRLQEAVKAGDLDLSDQLTSDWRWSIDDPKVLNAIDILREAKLLSAIGERRAEEVDLRQRPPPPPERPDAQAVLRPGSMIGQLALLGAPVVLGGAVKAKGPLLVAILHRHVLMEALAEVPQRAIFELRGVTFKERIKVLGKQKKETKKKRPNHLGPVTGPPVRDGTAVQGPLEALGGGMKAWEEEGTYRGLAGADAFEHVLLHALRGCNFIWDLISDAPHRLLEDLCREFEPRFLLPGEVVVMDEEEDCDFLVVLIHGDFLVSLEGEVIDRVSQGSVIGFAPLLGLNDWTQTITVSPHNRGEAMVQVIKREQLDRILAGHPGPKGILKDIRTGLEEAQTVDWRMLQKIPSFSVCATKQFLQRIHKDADVVLYCPGDFLAEVGEEAASMFVIIAGTCRSEHPQTLFSVELSRGDWCFQNNVLGIEPTRAHDVVAVTHVMVLMIHRHTLLNAVVAYPDVGESVLQNETWRLRDPPLPRIRGLRLLEGVPEPCVDRLEKEGHPRYFKKGAVVVPRDGAVEGDNLLFVVRGELSISILGIEIRRLGPGDVIGIHRFLDLPAEASQVDIIALTPCDMLSVPRTTLEAIFEDEEYELPMAKLKNAKSVLGGGAILDAFGFPVGKKPARFCDDCIETSEVFACCSRVFVAQLPRLCEERAFWPGETLYSQGDDGDFCFFIMAGRIELQQLGRKDHEEPDTGCTVGDQACLEQVRHHTETAVATTHVWARALHKKLLQRAMSSFPEEEKKLTSKHQDGGLGVFDEG